MIGIRDTLTLAMTKTRTRKVRTLFTIVIAGLLFSFIMTVLLVTQGFFQGAERLNKQAMTGRYIIGASAPFTMNTPSNPYSDKEVIARAQKLYDERVNEMKQEAKRVGLEFDPSSEPKPYTIIDTTTGEKTLSTDSKIGQQLMAEVNAKNTPQVTLDKLKTIATPYHPTALYEISSVRPSDGMMTEMVQGKESFDTDAAKRNSFTGAPTDVQDVTLAPQGLVSLYMLKDHGWSPASDEIPVVVTQKRAAKLLDFAMPTGSVSASQKLNYMQELRQKAKNLTFSVCYRNSVSLDQIGQAQMVAKEIAANKGKSDYVKPTLIYGTPDPTTCAPAPVLSDTRPADEKALTTKQQDFKRKFGVAVDPIQRKVTYHVVGIAPNSMYDTENMSFGFGDLISTIFATQSFRFAIPQEMYSQLPSRTTYDTIFAKDTVGNPLMGMGGSVFAEFASADQARAFSKNESCSMSMMGECLPKEKQVMLTPFGSNSLGIDDAKKGVDTFLFWLTVVIVALAAIISSLTIGRMIADGRRETAVFRAIGFKRLDIAQVYTTYTLLLCVGISVVSIAIALVVVLIADQSLWVPITTSAQLALGLSDSKDAIHLIGVSPAFGWVTGAVFLSGLLGMALPLLRNIRRNPIRDMRDE